ncbi:MAG: flagellar biosynthetic protein FliR [Planctomycetota bacterium]
MTETAASLETITQWGTDHMVLFILVLTRLSLVLMALPAIGVGIPRRVRAMLALLVTTLVLPTLAAQIDVQQLPRPNHLIDFSLAVAREAAIGMLIGATVQMVVTGLQLAGEAITSTGGMQLGDAIDPATQGSMPTLARLVGLLVVSVMLASGGHRLILNVLLHSFQALPAGQVVFDDSMLTMAIQQLSRGLACGVRVAAPVVGALLLSNLVTGLVSRTLPQINVLAIGLSINALAMLFVTAVTIGSAGLIFETEMAAAIERLLSLFETEG